MNPQQAQHEAQQKAGAEALPAAYPRLPWWAIAGRSAIMLGIGVAAEIDSTSRPLVFAALSLSWIVLEEQTERRIGMAALRSRHTALSMAVRIVPLLVWLLVLILGSSVLRDAGAPAPVLIAAAASAVIMALVAQPIQKVYYASLRRT